MTDLATNKTILDAQNYSHYCISDWSKSNISWVSHFWCQCQFKWNLHLPAMRNTRKLLKIIVLFQADFEKFNQTVLRFPFSNLIKLLWGPFEKFKETAQDYGFLWGFLWEIHWSCFEISFEKSKEDYGFLRPNCRTICFLWNNHKPEKKNQLQGNSSSSLLAGNAKQTIVQNQAF